MKNEIKKIIAVSITFVAFILFALGCASAPKEAEDPVVKISSEQVATYVKGSSLELDCGMDMPLFKWKKMISDLIASGDLSGVDVEKNVGPNNIMLSSVTNIESFDFKTIYSLTQSNSKLKIEIKDVNYLPKQNPETFSDIPFSVEVNQSKLENTLKGISYKFKENVKSKANILIEYKAYFE